MTIQVMTDQFCRLYSAQVYLAEFMCTCPQNWEIPSSKTWKQVYLYSTPGKQKPKKKQEPNRKEAPCQITDLTTRPSTNDWHKKRPIDANVIQFRREEGATPPRRPYDDDAGIDLAPKEDVKIGPWETAVIETGVAIEIQPGYFGKIYVRSSLAKIGLSTEGGVIDAGYRGTIKLILWNRDPRQPIHIYKGNYIAQMVIQKILVGELREVKELSLTKRGTSGFGSTDVKAVVIKKEITQTKHEQQSTDKFGYKTGPKLDRNQTERIHQLLYEFQDVLATSFEDIRVSEPVFKHHIDTGDHKPIKKRPYRIPPAHREWQRKENQRLEETGVTRPSNSPWAFPCVLAPKKGSKPGVFAPRQCHDYRPLNKITVKDGYPLPLIDDVLSQIDPGAVYLSVVDMFSGYFQVGLTEESIPKTSFVTAEGQWEYLRMPFGLCNAPATFQRMMNHVFRDMIGRNLFVYLDDVTILTKTFEEHMAVLRKVLARLRKNGLFLKPSKCEFATHKTTLLGFIIDGNGIRTDPEKVAAIAEFPRPIDRTTVRAFLGIAKYYKRFIPDFSNRCRALNDLLRTDRDFRWTEESTDAFK